MKANDKIILTKYLKNGVLPERLEYGEIMAIADGFAMVRFPKGKPFIRTVRELQKLTIKTEPTDE